MGSPALTTAPATTTTTWLSRSGRSNWRPTHPSARQTWRNSRSCCPTSSSPANSPSSTSSSRQYTTSRCSRKNSVECSENGKSEMLFIHSDIKNKKKPTQMSDHVYVKYRCDLYFHFVLLLLYLKFGMDTSIAELEYKFDKKIIGT